MPIITVGSRYLLFKVSKTKNLLLSDSQGKALAIANFTIISLPVAKVEHVYSIIPKKDVFDNIVPFIGCKNLSAVTSDKIGSTDI